MAPIMILIFGVNPATAVGTDLWFAAITKTVGGAVHHSEGGVDGQVLRRLCMGSLPAAIITLFALWYTDSAQIKQGLIMTMLGVVLLLTAAATLFRHRFVAWSRKYQQDTGHTAHNIQAPLTIVAGAVLGVLVTMTSVGAGALGVTMILCLYPLRMQARKLVATDIVHAVPLTLVGGIGHLFLDNVNWALLGGLLLGSIPGIIIGSYSAKYIPEKGLQVTLAIVLALVGVKMILS